MTPLGCSTHVFIPTYSVIIGEYNREFNNNNNGSKSIYFTSVTTSCEESLAAYYYPSQRELSWHALHFFVIGCTSVLFLTIRGNIHDEETVVGARRRQAITWTNVHLSSIWFCGTHLRPISQEVLTILIHKMSLKIQFLHISGSNEWK